MQAEPGTGHAAWGITAPAQIPEGNIAIRPSGGEPQFQMIVDLHAFHKGVAQKNHPIAVLEFERPFAGRARDAGEENEKSQ